jgi:proton glutamate symport protein
LGPFIKLLVTTYVGLSVFLLFLFVIAGTVGQFSVSKLVFGVRDALIIAFSTSSSAASLPVAFSALDRFGVSRKITAFVLPVGNSFNLTGSSLYLAVATLFWAQLNNIHLSWPTEIAIFVYILVVVRAIPPVPRGLFFAWGAILAQFALPAEGLALLLGIDPMVDMARTLVNVAANCITAGTVDRYYRKDGPYDPSSLNGMMTSRET